MSRRPGKVRELTHGKANPERINSQFSAASRFLKPEDQFQINEIISLGVSDFVKKKITDKHIS